MSDTAAREETIRELAREQYEEEGKLEVDEDATVSEVEDNEDGDNGAYVQAWVWVSFADTELDKENHGEKKEAEKA